MDKISPLKQKKLLIVSIQILIALLHFASIHHYQDPFKVFVTGYLMDILIPFAFYFLLCLIEFSLLRSWLVKSSLIFIGASSVEVVQYFGIPIFGQTFDLLDCLAYGTGSILAAIFDTIIFPRIFGFWTYKTGPY